MQRDNMPSSCSLTAHSLGCGLRPLVERIDEMRADARVACVNLVLLRIVVACGSVARSHVSKALHPRLQNRIHPENEGKLGTFRFPVTRSNHTNSDAVHALQAPPRTILVLLSTEASFKQIAQPSALSDHSDVRMYVVVKIDSHYFRQRHSAEHK